MKSNALPLISRLVQQAKDNRKRACILNMLSAFPASQPHTSATMGDSGPPLVIHPSNFLFCLDLQAAFCVKKTSLKAHGVINKQRPKFGLKKIHSWNEKKNTMEIYHYRCFEERGGKIGALFCIWVGNDV